MAKISGENAKEAIGEIGGKLTDEQWSNIINRLRGRSGVKESSQNGTRKFIEGVLWIALTRSGWKTLPIEYGNTHTIAFRFSRWTRTNVWDLVIDALGTDPRAEKLQNMVLHHRTKLERTSSSFA